MLYTFESGGPVNVFSCVNILDMLHTCQFAGQRALDLIPASLSTFEFYSHDELMQSDLLHENVHTLHIGWLVVNAAPCTDSPRA